MKVRRLKPALRLNAKPTRPHSSKHGARGYSRPKVKADFKKRLQRDAQ